ncbi:MAG: V-type ATP synthase subunit I [Rhabdochlamydiaceae bacterium]
MIRDVVKYLILGTREDLDHFFTEAQEQGSLEFISISQKKTVETPVTIQNLLQSIKILKKQPHKDPYQGGGDLMLAMQLSERIVELKEDLEKLHEERRVLETEKSRVAPFGDFSMDDISDIERMGKRKVQFFCMKTSRRLKVTYPDELMYIGTEYDLDYFISISPEALYPSGMIEMRIDAPLGEIQNRLDFVIDAIYRFEHELKDQAAYLEFLQDIMVEELNSYHLHCAKKEVVYPLKNSLFFIEAWVPKSKTEMLYGLIEGMNIYAEKIALDSKDRIPTYLENQGTALIGEDLIKIYDIPATTDKDPSSWVLWFFTFFFAIIVGDAGYGVIFLGIAFYLKKKFPRVRGSQKRMLKLFTLLSCASIFWGVVTSSYFGLKLAPSNILSEISPTHYLIERKAEYHLKNHDDVYQFWFKRFPDIAKATSGKDMLEIATEKKKNVTVYPIVDEFFSNIILELILVIGILHISLGFLRYLRRNVAGLGWVCFLAGGYFFFPSILHATIIPEFMGWVTKPIASAFGLQCMYVGVGFAILAGFIQHRLKGLGEIAHMVQVIADVLSYLRLYALSLAGAIMASTFNQEGSALNLFLGFIVILAGHSINMLLALGGGFIHGLRLNFIEWYHYCFDGGGRLFKPLHKLKLKG